MAIPQLIKLYAVTAIDGVLNAQDFASEAGAGWNVLLLDLNTGKLYRRTSSVVASFWEIFKLG